MILKGCLHTHSTCSDGVLSIPRLAEVYAGLGYHFLAITDHDHLLRRGCYDEQLAGLETGLIIFRGIELTVFERGYLHVNRIDGDVEQLHIFNHPGQLHLPLSKVIHRIERVAARLPIDAVEVTEKGYYMKEYDTGAIPFPKVATDDAHTLDGCGRAWVEVRSRPDKDSIIRAIRAGDFENGYCHGL